MNPLQLDLFFEFGGPHSVSAMRLQLRFACIAGYRARARDELVAAALTAL